MRPWWYPCAGVVSILLATPARAQQSCEAWQRIGVIASGHATVVTPSPSYETDRTVFLGVKKGGLWKGVRDASCGSLVTFSWTQLAGIPADATVNAVTMDASFAAGTGARMYAGTEEGVAYVSTTDFQSATGYAIGTAVTDIVVWRPSTEYVVISTRGAGIFRSTNGLATSPSAWGGAEETDTRALARVGNSIYAAVLYAGNGQIRYKDGVIGTGWAGRGSVNSAVPTDLTAVQVGTVRHAHMATFNRGLWRTPDLDRAAGTLWAQACDGSVSDTAFHVNAIALCPIYASDRELLEGRSDGPFWSFNYGGSTSVPCTPGTYRAAVTSVAYAPLHHQPGATLCEIFLGTEEGLMLLGCTPRKFDDPDQGHSRLAIQAVAMAVGNSKGTWAASPDGLLRNTSPTEMLVYNAFYGDVPDVTDIELHPDYDASASCTPGKTTLFMAERFEGVFVSHDSGSSWAQIGPGSWSDTETRDIEVSPRYATDGTIFAATKAGLRKWTGSSWTTAYALSATNVAVPAVYNNDWVVFSVDTGGSGLYVSTNGGASSSRFRNITYPDITAIQFSPRFRGADDQLLFARATTGVYFTSEANVGTDADFCSLNEGLTGKELNVRDLAASLDYISGNIYLVAATELGPRRRKWDPANSSATPPCPSSYPSPWDDCLLPAGWDPDSTAVAWGMLGSGEDVILGTAKHGVVWSRDDGYDYAQPGTGYKSIPSNAWATVPAPFDDRLLFITSADGIFVSTTGGAEAWPWNQASGFCLGATRGLNVMAWRDCAVPAARHMVFVGSGANQGIRKRTFTWNPATRSYDFANDQWQATSLSTGNVEQFDSTGQGATSEILAASGTSGFYTSTDCNGTTWTQNNPAGASTASSVRLGNDLNNAPPPPNGSTTPTMSLPAAGNWHYYRVDVPSGALSLVSVLQSLTGNANLYVRYGALPTTTAYDYVSNAGGTFTDAVCARRVAGNWETGIWYAGVVAALANTTYQLTSTVDGACVDLGPRTFYTDSFDGFNLWTLSGSAEWQVDKPLGLGGLGPGNPDPPAAFSGSNVLGTDLIFNGDYPAAANGYALSLPINCSNYGGVRLSYKQWLNIEGVPSDVARTQVSNNGFAGYSELFTSGPTTDASWVTQTLEIGSVADLQGSVSLRFYLTSNGTNNYSGWNIDDISLQGIQAVSGQTLSAGEWDYYEFDAEGNEIDLQLTMTPSAGNPDLYVRFGGLPTETAWTFRPAGAGVETVCMRPTAAGTYYVGVRGVNASTYALSIRRDVGCAATPFTGDVNVSHRPREARLVRVPTPTPAPATRAGAGGDNVPDPVPIYTTQISWGTVDGAGVFLLQGGSWQQRNGTGWGALSNTDAQSIIQAVSGNVYCGSLGNLFVSEYPDQGATTWIDIGAYVAGSPSWDITDFLHNDNGDILVAMQGPYLAGGGVWLSANKGKAWMQLNQGFDAATQEIMDLVHDGGISNTVVYYASSNGSGIYDRTITPDDAPVLTSVVPSNGNASGGTTLTLSGDDFSNACITGVTADCPFGNSPVVWFGGTPVTATWVATDQLSVVTPAHTAGTVAVTVMNPDTRESTQAVSYTFNPDGSALPLLTVTKSAGSVNLSWSPSGRVTLERSDSLPFQVDKSVDAVGSVWADPDAVLGDGTTYFYRATSK